MKTARDTYFRSKTPSVTDLKPSKEHLIISTIFHAKVHSLRLVALEVSQLLRKYQLNYITLLKKGSLCMHSHVRIKKKILPLF